MKIKVTSDYRKAQNSQLSNEDDGEDNVFKVNFSFNFNVPQIKNSMMKLPLMYEASMSSFCEKIETNPPISFDDLVPYENIEQLEFESEFYKECQIPNMSYFDPAFRAQINKPGCDYESVLRQRGGEADLEKIQKAAHEQMEMLKQDKKDICSGAIVKMPTTFLKLLEYNVDLILKSDQHPTLRQYMVQASNSSVEFDPQFNLYPY